MTATIQNLGVTSVQKDKVHETVTVYFEIDNDIDQNKKEWIEWRDIPGVGLEDSCGELCGQYRKPVTSTITNKIGAVSKVTETAPNRRRLFDCVVLIKQRLSIGFPSYLNVLAGQRLENLTLRAIQYLTGSLGKFPFEWSNTQVLLNA